MRIVADESIAGRIIDRLRLTGLSIDVRAEVVLNVLASHASELAAAFTVIAPESVRIRRPPHADA